MLKLNKGVSQYEDHKRIYVDIIVNGQEVGGMAINEYEDGAAVLERFDIEDDQQNKGYGTEAFKQMANDFLVLIVAPDNEDAKRLYERLATPMPDHLMDDWWPLDQGYGLYIA